VKFSLSDTTTAHRMAGKISLPLHKSARYFKLCVKIVLLDFSRKKSLAAPHGSPKLVVSLTTFPARISGVWAAIEAVFNQTLLPDRIVLTLAKEEFPDRKLPRRLTRQVARGLEVIWLDANGRSYDKLLPALAIYPESCIVTIDDDKLIPETLLSSLHSAHLSHPEAIVGARGWRMKSVNGTVSYGRAWVRAGSDTPSEELFMPGNGGVLYPPHALNDRRNQLDQALKIAPSADDIWFWGVAKACGTPFTCLGMGPHATNILQRKTPALADINETRNDPQFQSTLDYFDLRGRLRVSPS